MPAILLNDFGRFDDQLSEVPSQRLSNEYAKRVLLLFDPIVQAALWSSPNVQMPGITIGGGPRTAYFERNAEFLIERNLLMEAPPGDDDHLGPFVLNRREMVERNQGIDCLIHPAFLDQSFKSQPALSIAFLDDILPDPDVPLSDVLDFKEGHRSNLSAFWRQVYRIANGPDGFLINNPEQALRRELIAALDELEAAQRKWFGARILRNARIDVSLSLPAIAALASHQIGFPTLAQGFELLALAGVGLTLCQRNGPEPGEKAKAMTFILEAQRKLGG